MTKRIVQIEVQALVDYEMEFPDDILDDHDAMWDHAEEQIEGHLAVGTVISGGAIMSHDMEVASIVHADLDDDGEDDEDDDEA